MRPKSLVLSILILATLPAAGCKRESRLLREPPAMRDRITGVNVAGFVPGGGSLDTVWRNPYEESAYTISEGKRLFAWYNCAGCHAHGGGNIGPALMDSTWIYGAQPAQIYSTIVQGRPNGMPAWGGRIPEFQVWELVAYVRSLSGLVSPYAAPGRNDDMSGQPVENTFPQAKSKQSPGLPAGQR